MADVIPFRGILYNTANVPGPEVGAPPYDVITPEIRRALYEKSPYNVVRIDSGEELSTDNDSENKYTRAARFLDHWQKEGILTTSQSPSFYAYEMDYEVGGKRQALLGFFGLVRIVELGNGVYPHEETHSKPKVDRLNLTIACEANTSPIFSLYNSPGKKASHILRAAATTRPSMEARDLDGHYHRLWVIDREDDVRVIRDDLRGKAVYIADGHHRYETAIEYQRIMREETGLQGGNEPYNYVLMFLANIADGDITILPTHRVVKHGHGQILDKLSEHFEIQTIGRGDDIIELMKGRFRTFGLYQKGDGKQYILTYRGKGLDRIHPVLRDMDATILHELVLKQLLQVGNVRYEMNAVTALGMVDSGAFDAVFFLNPTRVEDVERVALSSMRMPPKSTYFYPKVMTGFVMNSFRNIL